MSQTSSLSATRKSLLTKLLSTRKQLAIIRQKALSADTDVQKDWASLIHRLDSQRRRLEEAAGAESLHESKLH